MIIPDEAHACEIVDRLQRIVVHAASFCSYTWYSKHSDKLNKLIKTAQPKKPSSCYSLTPELERKVLDASENSRFSRISLDFMPRALPLMTSEDDRRSGLSKKEYKRMRAEKNGIFIPSKIPDFEPEEDYEDYENYEEYENYEDYKEYENEDYEEYENEDVRFPRNNMLLDSVSFDPAENSAEVPEYEQEIDESYETENSPECYFSDITRNSENFKAIVTAKFDSIIEETVSMTHRRKFAKKMTKRIRTRFETILQERSLKVKI